MATIGNDSFRNVEAVFFWRYKKAAFAATYGRLHGTEYSKDFLQSPADQYPIIDEILSRQGASSVPLRHVWPGGEAKGEWRMSAADTRGQLSWLPMSSSPRPWRVGDPATDQSVTIPGNPNIKNEAGANAEYDRLQATGVDPWILAIKLRDENAVLHSRAYLQNPPPQLARRAVATLPSVIRKAILDLPGNKGGGAVVIGRPTAVTVRTPELLQRTRESLSRDPNLLLIGPPGTGKTVLLEDLRAQFLAEADAVLFDPSKWEDSWKEIASDSRKALSVVFHPSYGYEDFVAGLIPSMEGAAFRLTARPGPLVSLAHWAGNSKTRRGLLIIDEFNRGSTAAIFGDTLALLDSDKRSRDTPGGSNGATIVRPFPKEKMEVDVSFRNEAGVLEVGTQLRLPASIWIVAAMNSADRSIAPLDAALRRRFAILQTPPDYAALARHFGVATPLPGAIFSPSSANAEGWTVSDVKLLAIHLLRSLNERLEIVLGSDFLLGPAVVWSVSGDSVEEAALSLARAFDERIGGTLRLTFSDEDESLAAVLRIGPPGASPGANPAVAKWLLPLGDLEAAGSPRLQLIPQSTQPYTAVVTALRALLET